MMGDVLPCYNLPIEATPEALVRFVLQGGVSAAPVSLVSFVRLRVRGHGAPFLPEAHLQLQKDEYNTPVN